MPPERAQYDFLRAGLDFLIVILGSPKRMIFSLPFAQALTIDFLLDPAGALRGLLHGILALLTRLVGNFQYVLYSLDNIFWVFVSNDKTHVSIQCDLASESSKNPVFIRMTQRLRHGEQNARCVEVVFNTVFVSVMCELHIELIPP
jgi:hypothetical protein